MARNEVHERIRAVKKRRWQPAFEGMEAREVPSSPRSLAAPFAHRTPPHLARQNAQPRQLVLTGTAFGAIVDKGPGQVIIDTARPLVRSGALQTVHGILTRDQATNKVEGWLVARVNGNRQVRLTVTGNAGNTSFMGSTVNLKFTGEGEYAQIVRPGNIRLMLNTPIRGRLAITFA